MGRGIKGEVLAFGDIDSIVILRPTKYGEKQEPRAARQLAKGAFHLAEILNKIQWQ